MEKFTTDFLRDNPVFWSRLGFAYDPPLKNADGRPLVFTENLDIYGRFHRAFSSAGVKIHTSILHLGWVGVDEYDYSLTDRVLDEVFKDSPDIYYIPRIKLNVPVDWCFENPEDVFVYHGGPDTVDGVRELVGTLRQDYIGYEAPQGYYMAGDYVDTRPNVGGLIARQSFSSKKWLTDASEALTRLIERLESGKYADRIAGYHIAFGVSGESILWGRASCRYGDYGIGHKRAFFDWGLKKYGSLDALRKSWQQPDLTRDTVSLPSPDERYDQKSNVEDFFRKNPKFRIATDFDEFISEVCADAIEHFGKVIKKNAAGKLVGAFYGYFIHTDNPQYAGHLSLERLLNSPYVDFFAAPKPYYRCMAGEPGGYMSPAQSINRKKLWVDEMDGRTHLAKNVEAGWESKDIGATRSVLWRELAKNLSTDSGFWWMDLGGGWYDSAELIDEISQMVKTNAELRKAPHKSESDILVLIDEECILNMNISTDIRQGFMEDFLCELRLSGCLFDLFRLRDLADLDLSQYKLIIFAYTFKISEDEKKIIEAIPRDKTLMFNYAAGIISETSRDITETDLLPLESDKYDFPQVKLGSETIEEILCEEDGNIRVGRTKKGSVMNTLPYIKADILRGIAKGAGCHIYTEKAATIYGDNRFIAVFPTVEGDTAIHLKDVGTYKNILTGEVFENTDKIEVALKNNEFVFLVK